MKFIITLLACFTNLVITGNLWWIALGDKRADGYVLAILTAWFAVNLVHTLVLLLDQE